MPKIFRIRKSPLRNGFYAITLGELILTAGELDCYERNHELIHVAQQRELLYLPFFIWYVAEWLVLWAKYRNATKAYFNIRFEKEAYRHQHDLTYLTRRRHYHYNEGRELIK